MDPERGGHSARRCDLLRAASRRSPLTGQPLAGYVTPLHSPLLANVYLHDCLDQWYEQEAKPRLAGRSELVRFADDFVIVFERMVQAPAQTMRRLFDWLGVDPAVADDIPFDARNRANVVPWRRAIRWSVKGWFERRRPEDGDYRPPLFMRRHRGDISPAARRWLTDHYRRHNEQLRELLDDPLPEWP